MHKCYLLVILLCLSFQTFAGKISGRVTDAAGNEPLTGVVVVIKELNKGVQTDEDGNFEFNDIKKGTYEIVFSLVSYKKVLQTVTLLNKDVVLDMSLKTEGNTLKDVTIKAAKTTNTENAVMMEIKKSNLVVSGVSASQIAKTMDRNAADVVKRVPGVSIRDEKFIMVRGLYDRYNTVWLNDAGTPSSEVDKKSFSFDLIPSGLIDRILIFKTPAPELPGDFAGGMVKVYTTSLADRNQITFSYQASNRQGSTGTNFNYEEPSKTDKWGYDDGKRQLPQGLPTEITGSDSNFSEITKMFPNDWVIKTKKLGPDGRFNLAASGILKLGNVRIGNTFGGSYTKTSTNYAITRKEWDSTALQTYYEDLKSVSNVNIALMNNTAVAFGNSKIEFKNLYNQGGSATIIARTSVRDTVNLPDFPDEKAYAMGYESRASYTAQLSGTHKTRNDKTIYNWSLGYSDLFKDQPSLRRIKYSKQQGADDSMYQAGTANVVDPVNGGGRFYSQLFEHTYSFNHQITQTITIKKYSFDVSAGNYIEYKSRYFWARSLGYIIKPGANALTLKRYPLDKIFGDSTIGEFSNFNIGENIEKSNTYTAQNKLVASFISLKLPVGNRIKVYGGVRNEKNTQSIKTFSGLDSISPEIVTNYWLPSVNITYDFTEKSLLRAAYGKTLNRPEFREWAPFYFYDFEVRAGTQGALFPSYIHPKGDTLKVAEIQNYDLRWEWYPNTGEMIHAGVFYKSFTNPIQRIVLASGGVDSKAFTFANAEKAYSAGVEVEARKNFMFLDDWFHTNIFRDFTFVGNASFIKSEQTINFDTVNQITNVPLLGQSPYMYNAALFYQNDSLGIQGSILYNVYGPRIFAVGTTDDPSIGDAPFNSLDLVLSKTFFKHYTINMGVQNILDRTYTQVLDIDRNGKFEKNDVDKTWQSYKPGRYYTIGVKIKF
jgi:outer membrane receptor protein involved in Fe transport